jgi:Rps23 Pro-64 3,4-dihydroxylase Tpa1-like proline 4-hydroxylase
MKIFDGVFEDADYMAAIEYAEKTNSYMPLHSTYSGAGFGFKFSNYVYDPKVNPKASYENDVPKAIKNIKNKIESLGETSNFDLTRIYINAHSFGIEDNIHVDSSGESFTCILYLCGAWYADWGGETAFFDSLDQQACSIVSSVLPKYNRMVIFDGRIPHGVRPLSRRFAGVRFTMMLKFERKDEINETPR